MISCSINLNITRGLILPKLKIALPFITSIGLLFATLSLLCPPFSSFLFTPMTKKSSKMTPSQSQEHIVVEGAKPSPVPRAGNEIDEIFASKKRKKAEVGKSGKPNEETMRTDKIKNKKNKKKKTDRPDDGEFVDRPSRPRKKTQDGLSIYTEEELRINKEDAGSTPLCPFDCSCCF